MRPVRALIESWLVLDFFGESRRSGRPGGTLTTTIVGQGFVALVFAALLFPDVPLVAYASANLSLLTLLTALQALADPQKSARRHADLVLAGTAPLRRGTLALARALHAAFAVTLTTLGTALPGAILAASLFGAPGHVFPLYLVLALLCAGIAHLGLAVLGRALALVVAPITAELMLATLKAVIMGLGFLGFALGLTVLQKSITDVPFGGVARAWPPWWCGRILVDPCAAGPFWLALLGVAAGLLTAFVLLPEAELRQRVGRPARSGILDRALRFVAPTGARLGAARFVATMLLRSPGYRGKVLPLFGIPAAMVALSWRGIDAGGRLVWLGMSAMLPAMYVPFLVLFLPRSDQPNAAWIFASAPCDQVAIGRGAATVALTTHVMVPALSLAFLAMLGLGVPWLPAATIACSALAVGMLATHLATTKLVAMPFTQPDEESGAGLDSGRVLALSLIQGGLGAAIGAVSSSPLSLAVALLACVGIFSRVLRHG